MKKNLYYLHDKKADVDFYPMFANNDEVAVRDLSGDLRTFVSKNMFGVIQQWNDSDLMCIDAEVKKPRVVKAFRNLFEQATKKAN